jgi:hypothetical protein
MQHIHPKNDLFQRTRRHGPDDDRFAIREGITARRHPRVNAAKVKNVRLMAKHGGSPPQITHVPAIAAGKKSYPHEGSIAKWTNPKRQ